MKNIPSKEIHILIDFFGCDSREINSVTFWKKTLKNSLNNTRINYLSENFYKFSPQGLTGFLVLSASHLSVHTWPEYKYASCDVFTCGNGKEGLTIINSLKKLVKHDRAVTENTVRSYLMASKKPFTKLS